MLEPRTIFVSHAHLNNAACQRYVTALQARGLDVWIDLSNLEYGQAIPQEINQQLRARTAFLVMLTPAAVASPWVELETNAYLALSRRDPTRLLLPVLLEDCDLPPLLEGMYYVDATRLGFDEVIDAIASALAVPPHVHDAAGAAVLLAGAPAETLPVSMRLKPRPRWWPRRLAWPPGRPVRLSALVVALVLLALVGAAIFTWGSGGTRTLTPLAMAETATVSAATQTFGAQTAVAITATAGVTATAQSQQTATATIFFTTPYAAAKPGPCDQGSGVWTQAVVGSVTCTADAMRYDTVGAIAVGAAPTVINIRFDGPIERVFPNWQSVSVEVVGISATWCAELAIDEGSASSQLTICQGGYCTTLYAGVPRLCSAAPANINVLAITYQAGRVTFTVNGVQVDSTLASAGGQPVTSIELGNAIGIGACINANAPIGCGAVVDYKNFTFTPLP